MTQVSEDNSATTEKTATEVLPTMSNPNTRVAGVLYLSSSSSGNHHGDLANSVSTAGKLKKSM